MWFYYNRRLSVTGAGFLQVPRFPLPILIPPTAPQSSLSSADGTIDQLVADLPSGLSLTPPQEKKIVVVLIHQFTVPSAEPVCKVCTICIYNLVFVILFL
jgi:hypothetical protein